MVEGPATVEGSNGIVYENDHDKFILRQQQQKTNLSLRAYSYIGKDIRAPFATPAGLALTDWCTSPKQRRMRTFNLFFAQVREGSAIYKFADGSEEVRLLQLFE